MTSRTINLPPAARDLLRPLAGIDGFLVGGSVRDLLLGRALTDLDLAGPGDALENARTLADALGGSYVVLDEDRRMARVALDNAPVRYIDIAGLRGESIVADLAKRDFTVDALAAPLDALLRGESVEVIDPHRGINDIDRHIIRLVDEEALVEDPLRLLRAIRLAVQLAFEVEPDTLDALRRNAGRIDQAAAERQRDELMRCFATAHAARALRLMDSVGLLERIFPEITAARGVTQPKEHHYDVFDHLIETVAALDVLLHAEAAVTERDEQLHVAFWRTLEAWTRNTYLGLQNYLEQDVSEGRSRRALLKLAGLLHDVAKPETRAPDATGRIRFFGHAELGAETSRRVLRRLRLSRREIENVAMMVDEHLRPTQLGQPGELPTRRALYRFFRDTGEAAESVLLLSLADALAARGPEMSLEAWQGYVSYIGWVLARRQEEPGVVRPRRLLNGEDIMNAIHVEPGREIGRLLAALEEAQAAGEVSTTEEALTFVRRLHGQPFRRGQLVGASAT